MKVAHDISSHENGSAIEAGCIRIVFCISRCMQKSKLTRRPVSLRSQVFKRLAFDYSSPTRHAPNYFRGRIILKK